MHFILARGFLIGVVSLVLLTVRAQSVAQSVAPVTMQALAGSGSAGVTDGEGFRASFLMPSAVAFGRDHALFVADAAAQRIRIVRNGMVSTLAGGGSLNRSGLWVPGAFRDGRASEARFYQPSGVAVRADGGLYVADTFNHCIRLIAKGYVTTAAGRCGIEGNADGRAASARLEYPRGLTLARNGTLYIADQKNGIRSLDVAGNLRTLQPPNVDFRSATGVSAVDADRETVLYVANVDRLVRYGVNSHHVVIVQDIGAGIEINRVQGGAPLGRPYSICALSKNSILYGDLRDGSLRYVEDFLVANIGEPHLQYVGGAPPENAPLGLSGRTTAAFSAPEGIAVDEDGRIAVADAIQRRVVLLKLRERRHALATGVGALAFGAREYRIAIQGNSFVFFSSGFGDSIAGMLERRLRNDRVSSSRPPKVAALNSQCPDPELLASGIVDLAILIVNAYSTDCNGKHDFERNPALTQSDGPWQQTVQVAYARTVSALARAHVRSVLLLIPMAWEVSPLEDLYRLENIGYYEFSPPDYAFISDYRSAELNWNRALEPVGAPVVDTFPPFRTFALSPHSATLFATDDLHLSKAGRARVADFLARYLESTKPWLH